jgi:hypothetical protein
MDETLNSAAAVALGKLRISGMLSGKCLVNLHACILCMCNANEKLFEHDDVSLSFFLSLSLSLPLSVCVCMHVCMHLRVRMTKVATASEELFERADALLRDRFSSVTTSGSQVAAQEAREARCAELAREEDKRLLRVVARPQAERFMVCACVCVCMRVCVCMCVGLSFSLFVCLSPPRPLR